MSFLIGPLRILGSGKSPNSKSTPCTPLLAAWYESRSLVLLGFTEMPSPNFSENLIWKSWLNSSSHLRAGVFREYSNVFFSHSKAKDAVTGFPLAIVVASLTLNDNALLVSGISDSLSSNKAGL